MESQVSAIVDKLRRAYRNNTGTSFSSDELRLLAEMGVLHMVAKAEADEIMAQLNGAGAPPKPQPDVMPKVFSVKTLADWWTCSEGKVRELIASGGLRSFRHGNLIRIKAEHVAEFEAKGGARVR